MISSGSAARNLQPIVDALVPLLSEAPLASDDPPHILELGSFPYTHIAEFAGIWNTYEWWGTARGDDEVRWAGLLATRRYAAEVRVGYVPVCDRFTSQWDSMPNLHPARQLDIGEDGDWQALRDDMAAVKDHIVPSQFNGVIMCMLPYYLLKW